MESDKDLRTKSPDNVKMSGFLEKKGKMKLMSPWKKYWFVLEESLLLYYRSEVEYTNLSPCRGSLNMGLVSTVRPGSSAGPCVIHVITRTQVVQLRAKNRASQEEWLQALLLSMSLPLLSKPQKPITHKTCLLGYGYRSSLENISFENRMKQKDFESEWTLPRKLDYRKRQISGTIYGGSLDTAIWSKKFRLVKTPSPIISKTKMFERILGFSKDNEPSGLVTLRPKSTRSSIVNENEMRYVGKTYEMEEVVSEKGESEVKCKIHDENRNTDLYSVVDKRKKNMKKTLSDTELNKRPPLENLDYVKVGRKDDSTFGRIRNALTRTPKDKIIKTKPEGEKRARTAKKRRQSFLQKVFRKKEYENNDNETDTSDPLYDTIQNTQDRRSLLPEEEEKEERTGVFKEEEKICRDEENEKIKKDSISCELPEEIQHSDIQKPIAGSRNLLPAQAMTELRTKLKSREQPEREDSKILVEEKKEEDEIEEELFRSKSEDSKVPSLPPRGVSRPISPWHDVPTNNAPVTSNNTSFYVHQAVVKFNDNIRIPHIDLSKTENSFSDIEDDIRLDLLDHYEGGSLSDTAKSNNQNKKNDDLSMLLEQLTEITVAPLAEPEYMDDSYTYSSDSEKLWNKSQFSDPDYDIPRPHQPLNILISQESEIISSTEFMGRSEYHSDTGSSFRSIEPDSLEIPEKKCNAIIMPAFLS